VNNKQPGGNRQGTTVFNPVVVRRDYRPARAGNARGGNLRKIISPAECGQERIDRRAWVGSDSLRRAVQNRASLVDKRQFDIDRADVSAEVILHSIILAQTQAD